MPYLIIIFAFLAICSGEEQKQINFFARAGFIPDGDTVFVKGGKYDGKALRLKGIDAPERTQAFSKKSRSALLAKVSKEKFKVIVHESDKYERFLVTLYIGDRNINKEMVQEGWAWAYRYKGVTELYEDEMKKAQQLKLGLWKDSNPMAPWDFRKKGKN
ncbi:thermonuclease family protein [Lentisphaera marina]|uniref:thermonuclease family protein n=1 Tax=Lentisphaera marina TaxID=1111041 RepID=UPI00236605AA|nr:thermonuclease family protein [Lentisphaera marina]MDD7985648.1 thermonuclease family protein [Lentisphaera marina]